MAYRAFALDLDGTLLTRDDRVSSANREAVRAARDAGVAIIIATGRWFEVAESDYSGFRSISASMALAMALPVAIAEKRRQGSKDSFPKQK